MSAEGDRFDVDAGGRRQAGLKLLAKTGVIAKDFLVACNVVAVEEGREVYLVENAHRVAKDAMLQNDFCPTLTIAPALDEHRLSD